MHQLVALLALLALVAPVLVPAACLAQPANQRAEKEARSWLIPCELTGTRQDTCLQAQKNFIEQYVYAKAGDAGAQHSTASSFGSSAFNDPEGLNRLGMPRNAVQACAWWQVAAQNPRALPSERRVADEVCAALPPDDARAGRRRAEQLLQELQTAPARMPPPDWEPQVAGLPPSPPVRSECLVVLDPTSDAPPKAPPGCPKWPLR
jgi:hypothetical protein